jgi:hypothetical protein
MLINPCRLAIRGKRSVVKSGGGGGDSSAMTGTLQDEMPNSTTKRIGWAQGDIDRACKSSKNWRRTTPPVSRDAVSPISRYLVGKFFLLRPSPMPTPRHVTGAIFCSSSLPPGKSLRRLSNVDEPQYAFAKAVLWLNM